MKPTFVISNEANESISSAFETIDVSPYDDYPLFKSMVRNIVNNKEFPSDWLTACSKVKIMRDNEPHSVVVIRNAPVDSHIPELSHEDPQKDKYRLKKTYVAEATLESFSYLTDTTVMSYDKRFNGDFFTDVYAIKKYIGRQTGYSPGELVYHNDRTAHPVRADYITLLGMRCPEEEYTSTPFVSVESLKNRLTEQQIRALSEPYFYTPYDVVTENNNSELSDPGLHAILSNGSIRYLDSHTTCSSKASDKHWDAYWALRNALSRSEKQRHRILEKDLFSFPNMGGLHSREIIEPYTAMKVTTRWLLKTYSLTRNHLPETKEYWVTPELPRIGDNMRN